ncbi:penicillin-insensitive murein endopeptidase [Shewanella youngdeokensis]|uniref:Penicillin-insensitive murein endopeptidase n=1 Tax=Shewanella youngdeokensis TaxID=2999068 RepID=A0ABZ0K1E0_9GAMM|nr:penicillin-insensitive murein endopeptidase [Shewanella sp. DAU334]
MGTVSPKKSKYSQLTAANAAIFRLIVSVVFFGGTFGAAANPWEQVRAPYNSRAAAVGSYANGCLAGAKALPLSGVGFQVIRTERQRYYGHPLLISFINDFSQQLYQENHQDILIADMSMPRGGNFSHGHASHQIGLDVDIWFKLADKPLTPAQREQPLPLDMINTKQFSLDGQQWLPAHTRMLQVAAQDQRVARIFVSPVIKQHLCRLPLSDDRWLEKIRPWWGHTYHMHVRLHCPADDSSCQEQAAIPKGNGCNELGWWKQQMAQPATPIAKKDKPSPKKTKSKVKPQQCALILGEHQ